MDDGLMLVYNALKDDEVIRQYIESDTDGLRMRLYKYPETADVSGPFIVIDSIINGLPSNFSDDTWVSYDYLIHIEVWTPKRDDTINISNRITHVLWEELNFKQNDSTEEFDLGIYRDARRYEGQLHRSDLKDIS